MFCGWTNQYEDEYLIFLKTFCQDKLEFFQTKISYNSKTSIYKRNKFKSILQIAIKLVSVV